MQWQHQVSTEWLKARRHYLNSGDISKLYPQAKKWRQGDPIPPNFIGLWFEKHMDSDLEPMSYGDMARGHLMEPYAIEDFNMQYMEHLYHWDDICIHNGVLSFSPDALDVEQPVIPEVDVDHTLFSAASASGEIKSYKAYHHGQCVLLPHDKQEELLQVAMSMKVLPNLEQAYLIHYCPGAPMSMRVDVYTREDFQNWGQFDKIDTVAELWKKAIEEIPKQLKEMKDQPKARHSEEQVWLDTMKGIV